MNSIITAIRQFFDLFRFWLIIAPWEQALRVRLGRWVTLLESGVHLRLPVADRFYVQSVRQRISGLGRQTVTTHDGHTVTFSGAVGYSIASIEMLYQTLHHAEDTVQSIARAGLAQYFSTHPIADCTPKLVESEVSAKLSGELFNYGLDGVRIYVTDFAVVRTYRIIGDQGAYSYGTGLVTEQPYEPPPATPQ